MSKRATESATPAESKDRQGSIDALRGLALFGVLAINLETEFRVSIFAQFLPQPSDRGLGGWVDAALQTFIDMKAFAVFSLLFGVGLAIQFDRLAWTDRRATLLVRRLVILLFFGLIHLLLIWNGDILTEYALAGLIVLPLLFAPMWLAITLCVATLAFYISQPLFPPIMPFPTALSLRESVEAANRIYATGSFRDILAFRIEEAKSLLPLHVYVFPRTIGLFLLGALGWRYGLFSNTRRSVRMQWTIAALLIILGLSLTEAMHISSIALPLSTIVLALGYVGIVIAIEASDRGRRLLRWAEPLGRMAFTNYVLQSIIQGFVFYGYGLGLFGRLGSVAGLALVVIIYSAQVFASHAWLARFRFGPLEWLWRALMYGRMPKFRHA